MGPGEGIAPRCDLLAPVHDWFTEGFDTAELVLAPAMVQSAGLGVAYRGQPVLRRVARFRVDHGDLTALLYLQGFRRGEFHD